MSLRANTQAECCVCRQQPGRWMDCCLRSYSLNRHNDPVGSRVYMVTKTQMTKTVEEATSADAN